MDDEIVTQYRAENKPGMTINALKYIAIVCMVIDHAASAFVPDDSIAYIVLRFVGRITGPVMFFAAAEGYHHTKNINKYMLRLLAFAIITYFPFVFFKSGGLFNNLNFLQFNVIYTIFLGVTALRVRREIKRTVLKTFLITCLIVVSIPGDWGGVGVLMILAFDYFYGDFKKQAFGFCLIVLLGVGVLNLITYPFVELIRTHRFNPGTSVYRTFIINAGQFVPIILLRLYNGGRGLGGKFSKWFFYVFYPFQFLVLGVLQTCLK